MLIYILQYYLNCGSGVKQESFGTVITDVPIASTLDDRQLQSTGGMLTGTWN
jgi:hypothetical protein